MGTPNWEPLESKASHYVTRHPSKRMTPQSGRYPLVRACVLIAPSNNKVEGSPDNITPPTKGHPQKLASPTPATPKIKKNLNHRRRSPKKKEKSQIATPTQVAPKGAVTAVVCPIILERNFPLENVFLRKFP